MDHVGRARSVPSASEIDAARVAFTADLLATSPVDLIAESRTGWRPLGPERFPPCIGEDTQAMEFYDFMLVTTSQGEFRYGENGTSEDDALVIGAGAAAVRLLKWQVGAGPLPKIWAESWHALERLWALTDPRAPMARDGQAPTLDPRVVSGRLVRESSEPAPPWEWEPLYDSLPQEAAAVRDFLTIYDMAPLMARAPVAYVAQQYADKQSPPPPGLLPALRDMGVPGPDFNRRLYQWFGFTHLRHEQSPSLAFVGEDGAIHSFTESPLMPHWQEVLEHGPIVAERGAAERTMARQRDIGSWYYL